MGVSSRDAPPKSSRSLGLNTAVGPNGMPSVIGAGRLPHECGSHPEQQVVPRITVRPVPHRRSGAVFLMIKSKSEGENICVKNCRKVYDPREVEPHIYQMWMDNGCFKADADPKKKPFSIVMPPPNVTGQLHMGHAMDSTLQDILTRFKRMQGYSALWLPGTDHAGIATQIKVEERLREEEHLTRYDLGREKFLERVWAVEGEVRRPHRGAAEEDGCLLRLVPLPVHHGRGLLQGRA